MSDHDLVLFGATGFTGTLVAEYLARAAPAGLRWALAGRNTAKLAAVRDRLGPAHADVPLLRADVADPDSLRAVARSTRVVATTVGPYLRHGEPLVAACADTGTDYLDLTGEPEFADRVYLRHHERAVGTGARLVHACGFDSIPYDLGALYTVDRLPAGVPIRLDAYLRVGAAFSGGTYASALTAASRLLPMLRTARERARVEGLPMRPLSGVPHRERGTGNWAVPMPTIDPQIVARSAAARGYGGGSFRYRQYATVRRLPALVAGVAGLTAVAALAQVPPARRALERLQPSGNGPSAERRAKSWFAVRFTGEGGGRRVVTEVSGRDPGYDETAVMFGESALCLATDDLPETAGQVTTATAMGQALIDRLVAAGLTFRTLDE
ncbi:saccharopine dehydrogenase family protein [Amycolatopsis suaedae]|uniref:Saccharopine dehydrogenase n=1 Tax=Amycolatopsis suaedae TaxID=2510978 RepID=A0A4Q7J1L3_9PSEU|nr:saccharopine dehydrogenase NADP-binding domain-containing protein [Amycolatopsis suaedae]RZQ60628.1 saccharopine dehydrogenase [Amycolatopsis suaedae]